MIWLSAWLRFGTSFQVQKEGAQQEIITSLAPIIIISILERTVFNTAYLVWVFIKVWFSLAVG